jgi:hypothetical protein
MSVTNVYTNSRCQDIWMLQYISIMILYDIDKNCTLFSALCHVKPRSLIHWQQSFGQTYCLHLQRWEPSPEDRHSRWLLCSNILSPSSEWPNYIHAKVIREEEVSPLHRQAARNVANWSHGKGKHTVQDLLPLTFASFWLVTLLAAYPYNWPTSSFLVTLISTWM